MSDRDYITTLPHDVLHEIFGHLSKPDLLSIVKTHCNFQPEARTYLYRSIVLPVGGQSGPPHTTTVSNMFLQTLDKNPDFAELVRYVHLECAWTEARHLGDRDAEAVLSRLEHLRGISIFVEPRVLEEISKSEDDTGGYVARLWKLLRNATLNTVTTLFPLSLGGIVRRVQLGRVKIESRYLPLISVAMRVAGVESVVVAHDEQPSWKWSDVLPRMAPLLKELDIGAVAVDARTLGRVIAHTPVLTSLIVSIHGEYRGGGVATALMPIRGTLQRLEIRDALWHEPSSDGTRADFRPFRQLQSLRVSPGIWFGVAAFNTNYDYGIPGSVMACFVWKLEDRTGVYKLLPDSLQELEVAFPYPTGLFALGDGYHAGFPLLDVSTQIYACAWILELVEYRMLLPHLESVRLLEKSRPGSWIPPRKHWSPPLAVQEMFDAASVNLEIMLRGVGRVCYRGWICE